jgi:hypothetical protein
VDAYVHLHSLVTMDITRKQLTNTDSAAGRGPMDAFHNVLHIYQRATRPSCARITTLYSVAYLDMLKTGAPFRSDRRNPYRSGIGDRS